MKSRFDYLDSLRSVTILFVVGVHALGYINLEQNTTTILSLLFGTIAVPAFFLCDGFLLSEKYSSASFSYFSFLQNSAKRLLLPWFLFSVLYVVSRGIFEAADLLQTKFVIGNSLLQILKAVYGSIIAPQMYFLLSLFLIRIVSFISVELIKIPASILFLLFIFYTVGFRLMETKIASFLSIGIDPILHALWGFQYYLTGMLLARLPMHLYQQTKRSLFIACALIFLAVMMAIFKLTITSPSLLVASLFSYSYLLGVYFLLLGVDPGNTIFSKIGKETMGIYLLHCPIVLNIVSLLVSKIFGHHLLSFWVVLFVTFLISWGLTLFISRTKQLRFLFGIFPKPSFK